MSVTVQKTNPVNVASPHETLPKKKSASSPVRTLIFAIIGLAMAAWLGKFLWHLYHYEATDDAFIVGHVHQIGPQLAGLVKSVLVEDNQVVKAGDVLARLDPLESEIALERARAGVAQSEAQRAQAKAAESQANGQLAEAQARLAQGKAQQAQAKAQYELALLSHQRNEQLFNGGSGSISQQDVDTTQSALHVAEATQEAASATLRAGEAGIVSAQAAQEAAAATMKNAEASGQAAVAAVRDAQRKLDLTTITAPTSGRIGNRNVESGNRVEAGQAMFALVDPQVWIVANFKETQLAKLKPGMVAEITVDALSGLKLQGKIDSVAPASGAQFALLPPDNATGNFTKVVQRVPVKIILDPASLQQVGDALRPGFSVSVEIAIR